MDVYCQKCGEPWDVFSLHDIEEETPGGRDRFLNGEGCPACDWGKKVPDDVPKRSEAMKTAREVLGDDIDGIAAVMADFDEEAY